MNRKLSIDTNDNPASHSSHLGTRSIFHAQVTAAKHETKEHQPSHISDHKIGKERPPGFANTLNEGWRDEEAEKHRFRPKTIRLNRSLSNSGPNHLGKISMRNDCGISRLSDSSEESAGVFTPYSRIYVKLSTYCEEDIATSFVISKRGGTIGRHQNNDVCIPADVTLAEHAHATIKYRSGVFYLEDGINRSGTYIRLSNCAGGDDVSSLWPLIPGSRFRVGYSEFEAVNSSEIVAVAGKLTGQRVRLDPKGITIGRSTENTIHTGDGELSRHHLKIQYDEKKDRFVLVDVGSTNGSYMRLMGPYGKPYRLAFGDQLMVGKTCLSINRFDFGVYASMGVRRTMEDMHAIVQDMRIDSLSALGFGPQSFFGVYDGHGGGEASDYISENLHRNLTQDLRATIGNLEDITSDEEITAIICRTITASFEKTDQEFLKSSKRPQAGSTATTALICGQRLFVANVGDSRTVLCRNGKAVRLSNDHKPNREDEAARIRNAGGFVIHSRVMGELAVSRAFGDSDFKVFEPVEVRPGETIALGTQPLVVCLAEITATDLIEEDEFLVLACDGLFDVFRDQEVVDFIKNELSKHQDVQKAAETIAEYAINTQGSRDNVTVIIVMLK